MMERSADVSVLETLKYYVDAAGNDNDSTVYWENRNGKVWIVIKQIPTYTDQCKLLGMAERYKDDDGKYTIFSKVTHNLNSAEINVSDLMFEIRSGK